jgi:glycosyltransferase involved in cell wall biosynthesis
MVKKDLTTLISIIIPIGPNQHDLTHLKNTLTANRHLTEVEFILVCDTTSREVSQELRKWVSLNGIQNSSFIDVTFGNPGESRNIGIEASSGKWIQFWDSDDIGDLRNIIEYLSNLKADLVVQQYALEDTETQKTSTSSTNSIFELVMNPGLWRISIRRDFMYRTRFPKINMGEDQVFLFELLQNNPRIVYLDCQTYRYFIGHEGQLTKQKKKKIDISQAITLISQYSFPKSSYLQTIQIIFIEKMIITTILHILPTAFFESFQVFIRFILKNLSTSFMINFLKANTKLVKLYAK